LHDRGGYLRLGPHALGQRRRRTLSRCHPGAGLSRAGYRLAIVSRATSPNHAARAAERRAAIATHGLARYFDPGIFAVEDKDRAYADALRDLSLPPAQVAIVDDRMRRGIRWGNQHGALTIWFRNGKFADELPDDDIGPPAHTIARLAELRGVL
jgi:FMN phosphatase YigB (HAD superfamily)